MNTEEDEFRRIEAEAKRRAAEADDDTQGYLSEGAAELRRLHGVNAQLLAALKQSLHAMVHVELSDSSRQEWEDATANAMAAIAKGELK